MSTPPADPPRPTPDPERAAVLDVLRGFALGGILLINVTAIAAPAGPPGLGFDGPAVDRAVYVALILLVESKFFCLFSLLFGVGFAVQLRRAEAAGGRFTGRYARRLATLAGFGAAHVAFLWDGDILLVYAVTGGLLLLFRRVSDRGLVRWAAGLLAVPLAAYAAVFGLTVVGRFIPGVAEGLAEADAELMAALARPRPAVAGYWESVPERLAEYAGIAVLLATRVPTVLALFLLGLWAGRRGVADRPADHLPFLRGVRRWGLGLGLTLSGAVTAVYFAAPPVTALAGLFFNQAAAGPVLGLGYAAAVGLAVVRLGAERFAPVAAVGRMALTNYLAQSAVCVALFTPVGLGLGERVRPIGLMAAATTIYLGQTLLSVVWLRYFRYGPLEWVWRAGTYLRWPPLLREAPAGG